MSLSKLPSELQFAILEQATAISGVSAQPLLSLASTSPTLFSLFKTHKARLFRSILERTCGSHYKWPLAISFLLSGLYPDDDLGNDDLAKPALEEADAAAIIQRVLQPNIEESVTPFHLRTAKEILRKCQEMACRRALLDWRAWEKELEPALWFEQAQGIYFWTALQFCTTDWSETLLVSVSKKDGKLVHGLFELLALEKVPDDFVVGDYWYYFMTWRHSLQDDPTYLFYIHDWSLLSVVTAKFSPSVLLRMLFTGLRDGSEDKRAVDEFLEELVCEELADILSPTLSEETGEVLFHQVLRGKGEYTQKIKDKGYERWLEKSKTQRPYGSFREN